MIFTFQACGQTFILWFLAQIWQPLLVCRKKNLILAMWLDLPATLHLKTATVLRHFHQGDSGQVNRFFFFDKVGLFSCQGNLFGIGWLLFKSSKVHWAGTSWGRIICFSDWTCKLPPENCVRKDVNHCMAEIWEPPVSKGFYWTTRRLDT